MEDNQPVGTRFSIEIPTMADSAEEVKSTETASAGANGTGVLTTSELREQPATPAPRA